MGNRHKVKPQSCGAAPRFYNWGMTEVEIIRMELLEMEIARLRTERGRVLALAPHWRACALGADSDDERDTFLLCADQLDQITATSGVDPPPHPTSEDTSWGV